MVARSERGEKAGETGGRLFKEEKEGRREREGRKTG